MSLRWWTVVAAVAVSACIGVSAAAVWLDVGIADPPKSDLRPGEVRTLVTGLQVPWGLAFLPDGSALVTERNTARVLAVSKRGAVKEVQRFADVRATGEGGLLGIAVSPSYRTDQWVYAYYSTAVDNRIVRFHLGGTPVPVLTGIPHTDQHSGGRLAFGPDGMLYASTGDAANGENAQNRNTLAGKVLRITPDGKPAPGNPFGNSAVFSLGHRNVEGLAFDQRGTLYASELGLERFDELNRIEAGKNYGWPVVEGKGSDIRFVNPIDVWAPKDASPSGIAITGGNIYLACLRGKRLWKVGLNGPQPQALLVGTYGRLRTVVSAPDGTLWVMTSNRDGSGAPISTDDRILQLLP
ncbi:PQQ-dependent sugar dehydrogenase [Dactylosporangium sp. NPDC005555]|uniref:PQQ-dependent sugar dehydrogenase n=1 Tax=Dactylosporangium sp. NPDC005555 TaxID=3154889 RepID=UPI0033B66726